MLDGEMTEELRRCSCCEVRRPMWAFTEKKQTERNGSVRTYRHNKCRSCSSGNSKPTRLKKSGAPIGEVQRLANETIDRIRRKDGVGPWDPTRHRPEYQAPSLDEYVASRQEIFERTEAAPKPSRQVRRATERRIAKDARSITKRIMTDVEVAKEAISKGIAARSRANGGERTVKKTKSKVKWNLSPEVAGEILKRQGYRCALTGRSFQTSTGFGSSNPYAPSPNRIDPGMDYTPENCEFVLWSINRLISDAPRLAALDLLADLGLLNEKGPTQG